jgi:hypothetical protein
MRSIAKHVHPLTVMQKPVSGKEARPDPPVASRGHENTYPGLSIVVG